MSSRLAAIGCVLLAPACNAVWGLDEVAGEGGGAATSSGVTASTTTTSATASSATASSTTAEASSGSAVTATSTSSGDPSSTGVSGSGAGGDGTGGDGAGGTGTGGAGNCTGSCGCPTLFPQGDLETADDVDAFAWDERCAAELGTDGECGVLVLTPGIPLCSRRDTLEQPIAGDGMCTVARARARGTTVGSYVAFGLIESTTDDYVTSLNFQLGTRFDTRTRTCRLPDGFTPDEAWIDTNKNGSDNDVVTIDFVELTVEPCDGGEPLCLE